MVLETIGAAGLFSQIRMSDLVMLSYLVFISLTLSAYFADPGMSIITILTEKVIGYPVCTNFFCLAPSQVSVETLIGTFNGSFTGTGFDALFQFVLSSADVLKGVLGIFVVLAVMVKLYDVIFRWYELSGVFSEG